jgi:hypothetical protein
MVPLACRSESDHRELAAALQRGASAFESRLSDAERVCGAIDRRSAWKSSQRTPSQASRGPKNFARHNRSERQNQNRTTEKITFTI